MMTVTWPGDIALELEKGGIIAKCGDTYIFNVRGRKIRSLIWQEN